LAVFLNGTARISAHQAKWEANRKRGAPPSPDEIKAMTAKFLELQKRYVEISMALYERATAEATAALGRPTGYFGTPSGRA
jgi:hypothetical protein